MSFAIRRGLRYLGWGHDEQPRTSSDRRWWALGVLSITQLMVALDATVINIALPHAQR